MYDCDAVTMHTVSHTASLNRLLAHANLASRSDGSKSDQTETCCVLACLTEATPVPIDDSTARHWLGFAADVHSCMMILAFPAHVTQERVSFVNLQMATMLMMCITTAGESAVDTVQAAGPGASGGAATCPV